MEREMSGEPREAFAAIPLRALSDPRLSGGDLRMLGGVAHFDRFRRNHAGCYASPEKIAEVSGIRREHQARHAARLARFGYLNVTRSATDKRKRVYSVIYNDNPEVVTKDGDIRGAPADAVGATAEKVTNDSYKTAANVTKGGDKLDPETAAKLLPTQPNLEQNPALRDPVKQRLKDNAKHGAQGIENNARASPFERAERSKPTDARQRSGLSPRRPDQGDMHLLSAANQRIGNQQERRKRAAVYLGGAVAARPELFDRLNADLWPDWSAAYERAVDAEAERPGTGIHYLTGALKRHCKRKRAA